MMPRLSPSSARIWAPLHQLAELSRSLRAAEYPLSIEPICLHLPDGRIQRHPGRIAGAECRLRRLVVGLRLVHCLDGLLGRLLGNNRVEERHQAIGIVCPQGLSLAHDQVGVSSIRASLPMYAG